MERLYPFQGWRLTFFYGIVFAVFAIFGIRMYQLQIVDYELFQAAADENRLSELPLPSARGTIRDRNDVMLALNVPAYNVTIVPADLPASEAATLEIYNRVSALTGIPPTAAAAAASGSRIRSIEERVREGEGIAPYRPVQIATDIPLDAALQLLEDSFELPGVGIEVRSVRSYPTGALTSQIIGYMGPISPERQLELLALGYNPAFDRIGYAGLEYSQEAILSGTRGRVVNEVDVAGRPLREVERVDPIPGYSLRLSIDVELQEAAETALRNRISLLNATAGRIVSETGSVIAMNPRTGEILALVSYPSYDNSRFARAIDAEYYLDLAADPLTPLVNHVTQSVYPPGSVWKVLSAAAVLEEDVIDPFSLLNDPGDLILPNRYAPNDAAAGQRFVCWNRNGHGNLNMLGAIAQSCDVYFYQVGGGNPNVSPAVLRPDGLGPINLFRYATSFGIGSQLFIELPFENASRMPEPDWKRRLYGENWSTGDTYNAVFGQGYVNVTPLQLITAVAAVANGGVLYHPTVIRETFDVEGNLIEPFTPDVLRHVNLDTVPPGEPIRLLYLEDMIMRGPSSLACTCEPTSEFYNPTRCDPDSYVGQVDVNPDPFIDEMRPYTVYLPDDYGFDGGFCSRLRFNPDYRPPFVSTENIELVQQGMRLAVTSGTAQGANLPYVAVAGKTGTAEYCDEIARPLGLCRPGNWPAHAWFVGYAPYENPEIIIQAFVYNGGEGSAVALPIVVETLEAYFRLRSERGQTNISTEIAPPLTTPANGAQPTEAIPPTAPAPELQTNPSAASP
ncbi:MAG: penicillin-binding protein 2 [Candidatus Flexifilum sp.]|jgi:penicillin-binding protein 2